MNLSHHFPRVASVAAGAAMVLVANASDANALPNVTFNEVMPTNDGTPVNGPYGSTGLTLKGVSDKGTRNTPGAWGINGKDGLGDGFWALEGTKSLVGTIDFSEAASQVNFSLAAGLGAELSHVVAFAVNGSGNSVNSIDVALPTVGEWNTFNMGDEPDGSGITQIRFFILDNRKTIPFRIGVDDVSSVDFSANTGDGTTSGVPEPGSMALLAMGLGLGAVVRRRRWGDETRAARVGFTDPRL